MLGRLLVWVSIRSIYFISAFPPLAAITVTGHEIIQEGFNELRNRVYIVVYLRHARTVTLKHVPVITQQ
jgi:hypothetical protein